MEAEAAEEVEELDESFDESSEEGNFEDLPFSMPTQEQMVAAWDEPVKKAGRIYLKEEPCYARRALRAGTLEETGQVCGLV